MRRILCIFLTLMFAGCSRNHEAARGMYDPAAPQMTPEQMQEAMMKAMTPGPSHRALDPLIGSYKVESKMWMDPTKEPQVTTGTAEFNWILDGHYVQQNFHGTFQGQPFEGKGELGYDNLGKRYESTWLDSMGTQIMVSEGQADASGKVLTFNGEMNCPVVNAPLKTRQVLTIGDATQKFEMFNTGPDGKEAKAMEILYTRLVPPQTKMMKHHKK